MAKRSEGVAICQRLRVIEIVTADHVFREPQSFDVSVMYCSKYMFESGRMYVVAPKIKGVYLDWFQSCEAFCQDLGVLIVNVLIGEVYGLVVEEGFLCVIFIKLQRFEVPRSAGRGRQFAEEGLRPRWRLSTRRLGEVGGGGHLWGRHKVQEPRVVKSVSKMALPSTARAGARGGASDREHRMTRVAGGYAYAAKLRTPDEIFRELDALRMTLDSISKNGTLSVQAQAQLKQLATPAAQLVHKLQVVEQKNMLAQEENLALRRDLEHATQLLQRERQEHNDRIFGFEKQMALHKAHTADTLPALSRELAELQAGLGAASSELASLQMELKEERATVRTLRQSLEQGEVARRTAEEALSEAKFERESAETREAAWKVQAQTMEESRDLAEEARKSSDERSLALEKRLAEAMTSAANAALDQQREMNLMRAQVLERDAAASRAEATALSVLKEVATAEHETHETASALRHETSSWRSLAEKADRVRAQVEEDAALASQQADYRLAEVKLEKLKMDQSNGELRVQLETERREQGRKMEAIRCELQAGFDQYLAETQAKHEHERAELHAKQTAMVEEVQSRREAAASAAASARAESQRATIARTALAEIQGALLRSQERGLDSYGALSLDAPGGQSPTSHRLHSQTPAGSPYIPTAASPAY